MINYADILNVGFALQLYVKKYNPDYRAELTCAPGTSSQSGQYTRFIALTMRLKKNNVTMGYMTFRTKLPKTGCSVEFSSYELLDISYHSIMKFHLYTAHPEQTFKEAADSAVDLLNRS